MLNNFLEKLFQLGAENARDTAVESTLAKNSVTTTGDWLDGPRNTLPPLLPFLPSNRVGKQAAWGAVVIGAFCFLLMFGFTGDLLGAILILWIFVYGMYAFLYGGTCLQSPPALSVPRVYHFLGWKARLIGLFFIAISVLMFWFARSE